MNIIDTEIHIEELDAVYGLFMANHTVTYKKLLLQLFIILNEKEGLDVIDYNVKQYLQDISIPELMNIDSRDISNIYLDMRTALSEKISLNKKEEHPLQSCFDTIDETLPTNFKDIVNKISKQATKNDKMSWWRLQRELKILLKDLENLNVPFFEFHQKVRDTIIELETRYKEVISQREHVLSHIDKIKDKMKAECIHPAEQMAYVNGNYICKFCDTKIVLVD